MIFLGQSSGVPHNVYTTWLRTTQHPSVVVADVDGDSFDEVVMLSALKSSDHTMYLNSYNYNPTSSSFKTFVQKEYSCSGVLIILLQLEEISIMMV
ncbi:MAG: hypothetical protein K9W44_10760 [Candidatus Lokiarchaeota archaeon]|nr:hypothetical protein [Candidatus Harpocratesius repetitus]